MRTVRKRKLRRALLRTCSYLGERPLPDAAAELVLGAEGSGGAEGVELGGAPRREQLRVAAVVAVAPEAAPRSDSGTPPRGAGGRVVLLASRGVVGREPPHHPRDQGAHLDLDGENQTPAVRTVLTATLEVHGAERVELGCGDFSS